MHLADMTGVQLAQALHDDPACDRVGFVLASSESDGGDAIKALDAPLTVLLPKPFTVRRLAQALAQATGRDLDRSCIISPLPWRRFAIVPQLTIQPESN